MDLSERGTAKRRHPWEVVRGQFFADLLAEFAPLDATAILDVGAGDSWFGSLLAETGTSRRVVCWDSAYTDDELERCPVGVSLTRTAPDDVFDVVLMMDVLEHIEDPERFLAEEVRPTLAPGATVIASVPAHPRLFSSHDTALGHHRRYRPTDFLTQISELVPVVAHGPLFVSLTAPRALQVFLETVRGRGRMSAGDDAGVGNWNHGAAVSTAVESVLRADAAACRTIARRGLPIRGLSHWAVGKATAADHA